MTSAPVKVDYGDQVADEYWSSWAEPTIHKVDGYFAGNPSANFLPEVDNSLDDNSLRNNWRMGNGLGIARAWRKPDSQLSEGFKAMTNPKTIPYAGTMQPGRVGKSAPVSRNMQIEYGRRNLNNSRKDETPEGAGYRPYDWDVPYDLSQGRQSTVNNINAHRKNLNAHYIDPTHAYRRLYKPAPGKLTKKLHIPIEINQLRPQNMIRDPMVILENDPRMYTQMRMPKNFDVREMVRDERSDVPLRGAGPINGVEAYQPYVRTDHIRRPIGNVENGSRVVLHRWQQPDKGDGYEGHYEEYERERKKHEDNQRFIRGYDVDKEIRMYRAQNHRLRSMQVPNPYGV